MPKKGMLFERSQKGKERAGLHKKNVQASSDEDKFRFIQAFSILSNKNPTYKEQKTLN